MKIQLKYSSLKPAMVLGGDPIPAQIRLFAKLSVDPSRGKREDFQCILDTGHPHAVLISESDWKWFATQVRFVKGVIPAWMQSCSVGGQTIPLRPGFFRPRIEDQTDPTIFMDFPDEVFALFENAPTSGSQLRTSILGLGAPILAQSSLHIDAANASAWLEL